MLSVQIKCNPIPSPSKSTINRKGKNHENITSAKPNHSYVHVVYSILCREWIKWQSDVWPKRVSSYCPSYMSMVYPFEEDWSSRPSLRPSLLDFKVGPNQMFVWSAPRARMPKIVSMKDSVPIRSMVTMALKFLRSKSYYPLVLLSGRMSMMNLVMGGSRVSFTCIHYEKRLRLMPELTKTEPRPAESSELGRGRLASAEKN